MPSIILRAATRFLLPLLILFSIVLLLRGHNEPGGGFVGGLLAASAFALYSMAWGTAETRALLRFPEHTIIGVGLLAALISGIPAMIAGDPFLAGRWADVPVPGLGILKVGTPLLFDIGVYLTVLGVTLLMIFSLEEA